MDLDDYRAILRNSGVDIWTLIESAIDMASLDYGTELKDRRDRIIGKLYAEVSPMCRNCDVDWPRSSAVKFKPLVENERETEDRHEHDRKTDSPVTLMSVDADADSDEPEERWHNVVDDEQRSVLTIKEQIDDPHQSADSLVELLQNLADMDMTFKALKETDIGRHVNRLRKHPSTDVKILVKQLVRKWKDLVDEWVVSNTPGESQCSALLDGDSPQISVPKYQQNGQHQVPDFAYSPNPRNGRSGSTEPEPWPRTAAPQRESLNRSSQNALISSSAPPPNRQREPVIDPEKLASARKRLHENYQEAENARKQRTIQVMDIQEIPKPKKVRNGGGFQGRH
ncbi:hypothetical protein Nepgr_025828 [Nepenthes gracilis]|uniref:TFIIS N-terminal domain-containing protein n=1 Tax=Nepenthes gracilis TaxID=150966 RepID=A0AAD3Y1H6_NEPGR|nr:hypothetical protein Nepgr_025828 [Nepenthes gracilis]